MMKRSIQEALRWASSFLNQYGRDTNIGEILLRDRLQVDRTELLTRLQDPLDIADDDWLEEKVRDHVMKGIPVQHITGYEWFYGRPFTVCPDVLIPRPETEELVEGTLRRAQHMFPERSIYACDIGTGSGILAVTLALEHPEWYVSAVDISHEALDVARQNAANLGANIAFYHGSLLEPLLLTGHQVNVFICNPPYIPDPDMLSLDDVVKDHDPAIALAGGEDGLSMYRRIIADLPKVLMDKALVAFEIGSGQGMSIKNMLVDVFGANARVEIETDINQKERMVFAIIHNSK